MIDNYKIDYVNIADKFSLRWCLNGVCFQAFRYAKIIKNIVAQWCNMAT